MDIVISHIAALQVIRQPYFPRYLATAELCPSALPAHLPSPAELKEAHKTCGQLAGIEGDLGLLISSKKGTHACAGARPHVYSGTVPPGAILNDEVELTELAGAVPAAKKRKPDLLVSPVHKDTSVRGACIDYMGSEWHTSADAIKNDAIRRNELLAAGYIPFEIFKDQFADIDYMDGLMRSVREAACLPARRIGRARAKKERSAREELWARLSSVDVRAWTSREELR